MKCPFRKETHTMGTWVVENFGECYKEECPFFGKTERKKRYEGGYYEVMKLVRRRACESEESNER